MFESGIPFNTKYENLAHPYRTQKTRRLEMQLKAVEKVSNKRKVNKKQIQKMIDRNVNWKKQKDAKIYTQKLERDYREKVECTFNPQINQVSKALFVRSQ